MSAFEAVGHAKFTGRTSVCMATSGPGAVHLLNGLYDAKLDRVPVVAIIGQTDRTAIGGSYQQEIDLQSLYKDVASEYVQTVMSPQQLPNVLDRAIRVAETQRAPTAVIIPLDVQERSEEHTSELQSRGHLVCRHLLEKKKDCKGHLKIESVDNLEEAGDFCENAGVTCISEDYV